MIKILILISLFSTTAFGRHIFQPDSRIPSDLFQENIVEVQQLSQARGLDLSSEFPDYQMVITAEWFNEIVDVVSVISPELDVSTAKVLEGQLITDSIFNNLFILFSDEIGEYVNCQMDFADQPSCEGNPKCEWVNPEFVTNGTFDSDIGGWLTSATGNGYMSWDAQRGNLFNTGDPSPRAYTMISGLEIGQIYVFSIDLIRYEGLISVHNEEPGLLDAGFESNYLYTWTDPMSLEFTANQSTQYISIRHGGGQPNNALLFDNVSIKRDIGSCQQQ